MTMATRSVLLSLAPLTCAASQAELSATPVTKVIEMLNGMLVKAVAEKKEEEVKFAAFSQWCGDKEAAKRQEVTSADETIELLGAQIQKAAARIRSLAERVQELDEDVDRWETDSKAASDVRAKEKTDYDATAMDYSETIDAIAKAIEVLQKQNVDRPQVQDALLQLASKKFLPATTKSALGAFLQLDQPAELSYEAPEANAYESQSGGVVEMLQKLQGEFQTKKRELDNEEMNAQHAFEQITQTLTDNIENAQHEMSKKTTGKEETAQAKAQAQGDLALTKTGRAEDARYLSEMTSLCQQKATDFEARQKLRAGEIDAITKAAEIIKSGSIAGAAEKHLPTMLQVRKKALAQLRSQGASPLQARLALFLRERAESCDSQLLSLVSQRVASDPFDKVKKMIKDLISKLTQESTAETEHKGWCDTELTTNQQTRDSKTEEVSKLEADVEDLQAQITQLAQDLADLAADLTDLAQTVAKETAERTESKGKNTQTIDEAKQAQLAVSQAVAVLKEFYAKSAEATALLQQPSPTEQMSAAVDAPETWDASYKGSLPENGSVIDFLEVIESDFSRLQAETSTAESSEQSDYDKFMFESEKDKALKENEAGHKTNKKVEKESELHSTQEEFKNAQEQLEKAKDYYEKLKPTCVDTGITYEERVKRREAEMQSLQEALQILTGAEMA